ncbi:hypothetical protein B1158_11605 [Enterococcus faecium]|uniref:Uncharacterized protein n=1 Tax=Candidatus Jeotgalibaca merdavium TaxID=2838627 RepID=A0A9D2I0L5_9LACT|nr:hypothetical protein [Enterococcus faecium]HJA90040.1 hypothetical protein [Candidatus Jeotgalibaca merdavium]EGP4766135.1 hypothetical protein [Enterococcus faecium]EGP4862729.1 hypothetical protein [Enterococcus faecium]EGP4947456.1 hypothetical protein [Enterococcus faecium]
MFLLSIIRCCLLIYVLEGKEMAILIIDEGIQGEKYVDLTTDEMRNEVLKVLDDRIIQVEISKTPLQKSNEE